MTIAELRAVARMARRTARREWKRTSLIVTLIALPVAAAIVAATMNRAGEITPEEFATADFGVAELRIESWASNDGVNDWIADAIAAVDGDAEFTTFRTLYASVVAGEHGAVTDIDLTSPVGRGRVGLVAGSAPQAHDEIALADRLADRLRVTVGSEISLELDRTPERTYQVSGIVRDPLYRESNHVVLSSTGFDLLLDAGERPQYEVGATVWLVDTDDPEALAATIRNRWREERKLFWPAPPVPVKPAALELVPDEIFYQLTTAEVDQIVTAGLDPSAGEAMAYELLGGRPGVLLPDFNLETRSGRLVTFFGGDTPLEHPAIVSTVVAALLLAEVALVAGAAYATGTRRRLREIGLLGANGATPAHIRAGVLGEGIIGGLLGAGLGAALAFGATTLGKPVMQRSIDRLIEGNPMAAVDAVGPVLAGVVAATVAAWIPSRAAAGVPTLTALQGRMPVKPPARWVPVVGLGLAGFGAFLLVVAKSALSQSGTIQAGIGVALMIAGVTLLTGPIVAWIGRSADRLPATPRLVIRDSARQRTRAAAAISAVLVVLIAPIVIGIGLESSKESQRIQGLPWPDDQILVAGDTANPSDVGNATPGDVDTVLDVVPGARWSMLSTFAADVRFSAEVDEQRPGSSEGVVPRDAAGGDFSEPGRAALGTVELADLLGDERVSTALAAGTPVVLGIEDRSTLVEVDGRRLEAREVPVAVIWGMSRLLLPDAVASDLGLEGAGTKALLIAPDPLTSGQQDEVWQTGLNVAAGFNSELDQQTALWIALGVTLLVVLGIIGLVTALSATESDRDLRTVVAVGASPSFRRRFLGLQTGYYTFAAASLAAPLGWLLMKASAPTGQWVETGPFGSVGSGLVRLPWNVVGLVVVVLPIVVGLATAALARSLPSALPRRVA